MKCVYVLNSNIIIICSKNTDTQPLNLGSKTVNVKKQVYMKEEKVKSN